MAAIPRDGTSGWCTRIGRISFGERSDRAADVTLAAHRQKIYPGEHEMLMRSPRPDHAAAMRSAVEQAGGDWEQLEDGLIEHDHGIATQLTANRLAGTRSRTQAPGYLIGPFQSKFVEHPTSRSFFALSTEPAMRQTTGR
jgi:hypothetical protein